MLFFVTLCILWLVKAEISNLKYSCTTYTLSYICNLVWWWLNILAETCSVTLTKYSAVLTATFILLSCRRHAPFWACVTYIHTYIHTHIHTYTHTYIHTHTHTHTYIYRNYTNDSEPVSSYTHYACLHPVHDPLSQALYSGSCRNVTLHERQLSHLNYR